MRSFFIYSLLGALLPLSQAAALPETPPVVGVVRDTSGAPLAHAQVILPALDRVTTTNAEGQFTFAGLPAGAHHITTVLIGHAPAHADVVVPESGTTPVNVAVTMRPSTLTLAAVQVTATPIGTDPRNLAQATAEVSGRALTRAVSSNIAQTLSGEPGVAVRYDAPGSAMPVIRGLTGERILILQDGQRSGDLASSSSDHGVSIDPLMAERIEVVRGPASLLYGNNALGGVVNVISNDIPTQVPSHVEGALTAQTESVTPGGAASAGVTVPFGSSFALALRGGVRSTSDLRQGGGAVLDNTFSRNAYGGAGLGYIGARSNAGLLFRTYDFNYGLPSPADADDSGVSIEGRRHELTGRGDLTLLSGLFTSLRAAGTAQSYNHDEIESSGEIGTTFRLKTQTVDLLGRTQVGRFHGALGASGLFRQYSPTGEEAVTPGADSRGLGAFLYQELPLRLVLDEHTIVPRLQLGARYDVYDIDSKTGEARFGPGRSRRFRAASGSVGITIPANDMVSVSFSAARAFRAPTVEELFSNGEHHASGTYDLGNPLLEQETSRGVDGIVRLTATRFHGQIAAFSNRVANFITPNFERDTTIIDAGESETIPLNVFTQGDGKLRGVEGRLEAEVSPGLVIGAMGDMVRGTFNRDGADEPLPFIPASRIGGLVRYDNGRYSADVEAKHAFAQTRVPVASTERDASAVATGAYDLLSASLSANVKLGGRVHTFTLRGDNLTDVRYREATSQIKSFAFAPGRNFALVYKVLF